jgi:hypothetical protein
MRPIILFLIAASLFSPGAFLGEPDSTLTHGTSVVRANADMIARLAATGPQTKAPMKALFDRLVGTWDVSYEIYDKDGNVRRYRGQAIYTWILDGGALQEVWTSDAHNKEPQPYGTTIGFYDGTRQRWTAVWIYPAQGMTTVVSGREVDGRMVLTGPDQTGAMQRWSISDIQTDSFVWHFESSSDEGKSWRLLGVNHMHRHQV